jgi:hypothetical protein
MKRFFGLLFVCLFAFDIAALAGGGVPNDRAAYVAGTESQVGEGTEGSPSTGNEKEFVFEYESGQLIIPYDQINDLEYGQQAGRRVGLAVATGGLFALSKKRTHFLTIGWKDEKGKQHAAVFELGKSIVRDTIVKLEAKTGRKVDYQDNAARKSGMGGM